MILSVFFPIAVGVTLFFLNLKNWKMRNLIDILAVSLTSVFIIVSVIRALTGEESGTSVTLVRFSEMLTISFKIDRASCVFALIIAVLWPLTMIYSFSYMEHEKGRNLFYSFFTISYGVVCGIAFAEDLFTMYLFYELMTLTTLPLVMHDMDAKAKSAGKKYITYSMIGASMIFIVLVFFLNFGTSLNFTYGGILDPSKSALYTSMIQPIAVVGFFGFGVKAALFPFHDWLPSASVAPTPVTALLHAVAVVKAGAFCVLRILYYCFGTESLFGTPAQFIMILFASITIVYGSCMAFRCPHFKRRLAYSTISNLSYILLGFAIMTPEGMTGGLLHMIYHAAIKITLFFCAGAILVNAGREYVYELEGFGKRMPLMAAVFTVSAFGLMGIPPLACFISKFTIGSAAAALDNPAGYIGDAALIVSAVLTILYLTTIIIRFYFPMEGMPVAAPETVQAMDKRMSIPMVLITVLGVILALSSKGLFRFLNAIPG